MKGTSKQARVIHDLRATEYDSFFFFFWLLPYCWEQMYHSSSTKTGQHYTTEVGK